MVDRDCHEDDDEKQRWSKRGGGLAQLITFIMNGVDDQLRRCEGIWEGALLHGKHVSTDDDEIF